MLRLLFPKSLIARASATLRTCRVLTPCLLGLLAAVFLLLHTPVTQAEVVRTGYTSIVAANSAQCLDINGSSTAAGAAAIQWPCNNGANQEWTVQLYSPGLFRIVTQHTLDCLVVSSATAGAPLVQEPCSGVATELWSLPAVGSAFQLVNSSTGQCASINGASTASAAKIVQEPCSATASFLWTFTSGLITPLTPAIAQAGHSGQCMNISVKSTAAGANVVQSPCAGATNEQWSLVPSGSFYALMADNSGLCISNQGLAAANTPLLQETCASTTASGTLWSLVPMNGSYEFVSANSGLCIIVPKSSLTPGTNLVQSGCNAYPNEHFGLSFASLPSKWSPVIKLPVNPIGISNMPNGNLVMWSAFKPWSYETDVDNTAAQTYTGIFNPTTLTATDVLVTNTGDDMFCPGTANLFDGTLLVNGGSSSPKTSLFNPTTGLWATAAEMNIRRGYEADTVLANGSVLTLGGSWTGSRGIKNAEVFTPGGTAGAGSWTELTNVPDTNIIGPDPQGVYRGDNHAWLFTAPNGLVFHAGPSAQMNWINPAGTGTITSAGNRANDPYSINGSAVLYDVGLILKAGGAPAYQEANAEANAYIINLNKGVGGVTTTQVAPMTYPRAFSNGVVLPNGQVLVIGGETWPDPFYDATAILVPEIWDPLTTQFRQLNPMVTPRVYHSTAILLQDGRVFSGGGGQCGEWCIANHLNTEILTPPYLLNPDGTPAVQPVISAAPATAALGTTISVTTGSPVESFVLMRLSSTTHTVNNDQRRVPVTINSVNGATNTYTLAIPSNPGIALPGYYWLYALNAQGVPSVGSTILISSN